ncbi:MAG: isochorismate synthase [Candidatus Cyclonatronum sp.]|uniref:isochorismate synthase n=1 Tax=Cyclonatronum sp. TaxID=3024185 RepID=UPI0025C2E402|nr:isochorismate synthase [Cyclonatronum sp.]MCC5933051.1 isochorismate synthase [Balneolales bacterium]MCH8485724.1 isochorismate synthase [Cyclonatronum sp.]
MECAQEAVSVTPVADQPVIFSVTVPFENIDPLAVLEILAESDQFQYYWEHPDERLGISAGRAIRKISCPGQCAAAGRNGKSSDRFTATSEAIKKACEDIVEYSAFRHSLAGVHFLGGFSFFDRQDAEAWKNFNASDFFVPEWSFVRDGELCLLTVNKEVPKNISAEKLADSVRATIDRMATQLLKSTSAALHEEPAPAHEYAEVIEEPESLGKWIENISAAKKLIELGALTKIVLSRMLRVRLCGRQQPTRILNQLRNEYPSCYTFMMRPEGKTAFVGSTPERLLSIRSNYILTEGLAGSISRGKTATEDAIMEKKLLSSAKDLEEHRLVVEDIREKLRNFCDEVNHPAQPGIKKFTNVQHLYTPISAWTNNKYDPFVILRSLHPTPAVGGVPSRKALGLIPEYELYERGWYAAPVGWLNSKGRGEFVVAIRSGLITEHEALFYAGCGIVQDSDPVAEWEETKLKLIPMLTAINHA